MKIFYTKVGPSALEFETSNHRILFTTPMYNRKTGNMDQTTVEITEEEWLAIIKYGEQAGFYQT